VGAGFPVRGGGRFPRPFGTVVRDKLSPVVNGTEVLLVGVDLPFPQPINLEVAPFLPNDLVAEGAAPFTQVTDVIQLRIVTSKNKDDYPDALYRLPANGFTLNLSAKSAAIWAKHDLRAGLPVEPYEYFLGAGISPGILRRDSHTDSWNASDFVGNVSIVFPMPAYARSVHINSIIGDSIYEWLNTTGGNVGMPPDFKVPPGAGRIPVPARASGLRVITTVNEPIGSLEWGF